MDSKTDKKRVKAVVQFNENVETHVFGERKWNDYKTRGATFTKGSFTAQEIKTLMDALCTYVRDNSGEQSGSGVDPMETLTILCSRSRQELP